MTRREWLLAGGFAVLGGCGPKKGTGYPGYALIATEGDTTLAVVDLTAFRLLKPINLGASPTAVIASPSASYVLTPANGTVHVVDGDLNRVASRRLADEVSEIRLTGDGRQLFATSRGRELIETDAMTLRVVRRHKLDAEPAGLDVFSDPQSGAARGSAKGAARYAAVSTGGNGTVELFDVATGQRTSVHLPDEVRALRFRADGQILMAAHPKGQSLTALEVPSLRTVAELPLAMQPDNLCFTSDQGQLFVSGQGMDGVAIVFPYGILEVEQTLLAGRDPGVMACSGLPSNYLFVGSNSGSEICILSVDTRRAIALVQVGQTPTYITITPDDQYALVLDKASGTLAVIFIPAIHWNRERSGAALFTVLQVGEKPVHAAVVPAAHAA